MTLMKLWMPLAIVDMENLYLKNKKTCNMSCIIYALHFIHFHQC